MTHKKSQRPWSPHPNSMFVRWMQAGKRKEIDALMKKELTDLAAKTRGLIQQQGLDK